MAMGGRRAEQGRAVARSTLGHWPSRVVPSPNSDTLLVSAPRGTEGARDQHAGPVTTPRVRPSLPVPTTRRLSQTARQTAPKTGPSPPSVPDACRRRRLCITRSISRPVVRVSVLGIMYSTVTGDVPLNAGGPAPRQGRGGGRGLGSGVVGPDAGRGVLQPHDACAAVKGDVPNTGGRGIMAQHEGGGGARGAYTINDSPLVPRRYHDEPWHAWATPQWFQ